MRGWGCALPALFHPLRSRDSAGGTKPPLGLVVQRTRDVPPPCPRSLGLSPCPQGAGCALAATFRVLRGWPFPCSSSNPVRVGRINPCQILGSTSG